MLASLRDLVVYLLLALAAWVRSLNKPVVHDLYVVSEGEDVDGHDLQEAVERARFVRTTFDN